ncbi:hypothetical protein BDY19DRAFT_998267 [Irpex rosettiformis]|uniref:Uncharacterized protein n=1 Tax=Irpex rosettiformis TaxID=378272 RepID=A0ACB8TP93_9APHY|nr:hypothetical protein BDY19DRAFT_998267 [Irpex rosettiformis]
MADYPQLKIIALVATAIAHHYSIISPVPPVDEKERLSSGQGKTFEYAMPLLRFISESLVIWGVLSEITAIAVVGFPNTTFISQGTYAALCPNPIHKTPQLLSINIVFGLGVLLAVCGTALRLWCFRVLGRLFTSQVSLRPSHTLVQEAPYNFVRHPSYTGMMLHDIGIVMVHFSPNGWDRECGIMYTLAGPCIALWMVCMVYIFFSLWKRTAAEDELLKGKFGPVWEQYARDVPWKLFPYIT